MKSRILIAIFVVATIVLAICAGAKVFEKEDVKDNVNNANINIVTSLEDKLSDNSAWCGTFNLIWNDLKNDLAKQDIKFPENSAMVDNLNKGTFTTNELSEASYYKTYGTPTLELKAEIERAIKQKFNETSDILDSFDWSGHTDKDYFLYAMLKKEFEYPKVFDKLENGTFENYNNVRYFGITGRTKDEVKKQVQVLYYNSENDFALKIQTKGNDEIIVSVGNKQDNFLDIYNGIINKSESYKDWKGFRDGDTFKMPYITFDLKEEITEVENKPFYFSNGDEYVIQMALQTIQFDLDEKGGRVKSEAGMMVNESAMEPQEPRNFNVDQAFTIFLIETEKELPYFAAKISDISSVQSGVKPDYEVSGENLSGAKNEFDIVKYVNEIQEKISKLEEGKKIDIILTEEIYGKELTEFMQGMEIDEVSGTIITDEENFVTIMPMPDFLDNQSYYFENEKLVAYKRDFMGIGGSVTYYFKDDKLVFIDESKIEPEMVFKSEDVANILVRADNVYKNFCDMSESNNININDFYSLEAEEYAARGEEVDLLSEYDFIEKIANQNDLEIGRQLKVYVSEHENQMRDEYSKFQENSVIYKFKNNRDYYVEMLFSENEILGTWKENSNNVFVDSVIENETVHLFEWKIAYDDYHNNARAQFNVDGMNFIVKAYDISHEEFIEIVGTTIREYKSERIME